jgi:hypothetical protein
MAFEWWESAADVRHPRLLDGFWYVAVNIGFDDSERYGRVFYQLFVNIYPS